MESCMYAPLAVRTSERTVPGVDLLPPDDLCVPPPPPHHIWGRDVQSTSGREQERARKNKGRLREKECSKCSPRGCRHGRTDVELPVYLFFPAMQFFTYCGEIIDLHGCVAAAAKLQ